jgi:cyclophilin family peptidyl-prolyl cis-trans isomerase
MAVAAAIAILVALAALLIVADRVAGRQALAVPTPSPPASETPSGSPGPVTLPYADCGARQFGAALAPSNPPADVHKYPAAPAMEIDTSKVYLATITTAKGAFALCLQPNLAPATVNNFVVLARNHFYDGLTFHRVVADFVVQGGDPAGTGNGGPGYSFADEPVHQHYVDGAVAMANSGPNTNGSQFFVCTGAQCATLQPQYNLFAHVQTGLDTARKIVVGDVMTSVTVAEER